MTYTDDLMDAEQRLVEAQEVGPDGLGVNDHLSRLPDLCLLEVFKRLKRQDIHNLTAANRRIYPVTKDGSLDKIRWEDGTLMIYQTWNGYGFHLIVGENCPWRRTDVRTDVEEEPPRISFHYEIWKDMYDEINERKWLRWHQNGLESDPAQRQFYPHLWTTSYRFFNALAEILRLHEIKTLQIYGMAFETKSFFEQLHYVFSGRTIEQLDCNMHYTKNQRNGSQGVEFQLAKRSFVQFIQNVRRVDLTKSTQVPSLISEQFLKEISSSNIVEFRDTGCKANGHVNLPETTFSSLIQLDSLASPAMRIHRNSFAKFCMMYMDARRSGFGKLGSWTFAVSPPINLLWIVLSSRRVQHPDYHYETTPENLLALCYDGFLVSNRANMTACFKVDDFLYARNVNYVTVDFRDNAVENYNEEEDSDNDSSEEDEDEDLEYESGEDVEDEEMDVDDKS